MRRALLPAAGLLLAVPAAAAVVISEKCVQLVTKPVRHSIEEVIEEDTGHGLTAGFRAYETWRREPFTLERGGTALWCERIDNPADRGARRKVAIICHGHTVNHYSSLKYADIFYRAGFSLVLFDQRYFGASGGDCCTLGQEESLDLAAIIRETRRYFGQDALIALHGESMGAATALLVLRYERPDLVVADCPFADSELLFGQWIRRNLHIPPGPLLPVFETLARIKRDYHIRETCPIEAVRNADVPICLIHGSADTLIPCGHSEALYKACRSGRSELHLVDGAAHAQSIVADPAAYEEIVRAFLKNCGAI